MEQEFAIPQQEPVCATSVDMELIAQVRKYIKDINLIQYFDFNKESNMDNLITIRRLPKIIQFVKF